MNEKNEKNEKNDWKTEELKQLISYVKDAVNFAIESKKVSSANHSLHMLNETIYVLNGQTL